MAIKIKKLQPLLNEDISALPDMISIKSGGTGYSSMGYGAIPPLTSSDLTLGNISINNGTSTTYTLGSAAGANANAVWTTTGTGTGWQSAIGTITPSATINLKGENADIDINGKSMKAWMEKVEERLNILTPNPELEKEWDELRKLGEKYRKLEKRCKEKSEVWKRLSAKQPEI